MEYRTTGVTSGVRSWRHLTISVSYARNRSHSGVSPRRIPGNDSVRRVLRPAVPALRVEDQRNGAGQMRTPRACSRAESTNARLARRDNRSAATNDARPSARCCTSSWRSTRRRCWPSCAMPTAADRRATSSASSPSTCGAATTIAGSDRCVRCIVQRWLAYSSSPLAEQSPWFTPTIVAGTATTNSPRMSSALIEENALNVRNLDV